MDISLFLAQAFGIYFVVMGLMLFKGKTLDRVVSMVSDNGGLKLITGIITLILGIILILVHNIWEGPVWVVLITVIGWLTFLKAIMYLLLPHDLFMGFVKMFKNKSVYLVGGVVIIVVGLWLMSIGFGF